MVGIPLPQPPPQPETNGIEEKFNMSDVYPQEDGSDIDLSDRSESEKYRHKSDQESEEGESRYRMRSSRQPPAKRRRSDMYKEYMTDDDYDD